MKDVKTGMKRVNFDLDEQAYERLQKIAKARKTTVANRLREYTKLGLAADHLVLNNEGDVIIRDKNGRERTLLF